MQYDSEYNGAAIARFRRQEPLANCRRLESAQTALGVKLLNVSLSDIALHYYEGHLLLNEAIYHVAAAFKVEPQRVVPLQLRPDERSPTAQTIWTFTIRDASTHDLLGQMREMFQHSAEAFGEWRFGSRKVLVEPLILGSTGVVHGLSVPSPLTAWQRPGAGAECAQGAEVSLQILHVDLLKDLKTDAVRFENRLLRLREAVASTLKSEKNPEAFQVVKYSVIPEGTIIEIAPATPDIQTHNEQLRELLMALETGKLTRNFPGIILNIPASRNSNPAERISTVSSRPLRVVDPGTVSNLSPKGATTTSNDINSFTNKPVALSVVIVLTLLAILVGIIGLCILCWRRRVKAKSKACINANKRQGISSPGKAFPANHALANSSGGGTSTPRDRAHRVGVKSHPTSAKKAFAR